VVVQDRVHRQIVWLGLKVGQKVGAKAQPHGEGPGRQAGEHAVIKAAAIAQPVAARRIAHAGHKQQRGVNHLGVFGLENAVSIFFHWAAGVPGMKSHGFVNFVHHRQSNLSQARLFDEFAVFFPAVQGWQGVKFPLDRPVGPDHRVRAAHQPDAHDLLQGCHPGLPIRQSQALLNQLLAQGFFLKRPFFIRVIHNLHMQFRTILTLITAASALCSAPLAALAAPSGTSAADEVLLEMNQAFKKGQSKRLSELLPRAQGHVLEPWAAYWELRARLESASADEVAAFFKRYQGTYQEDRLRNDWLLLLGQRRDWSSFVVEAPQYRMKDDREVRCYTLAMEHILAGVDMSSEVKDQWYPQKEAGEGCALAAQVHFDNQQLRPTDIWRKARLALEARQIKALRQAIAIVAPQADGAVSDLLAKPEPFLAKLKPASQRQTQELAVLALIRLADSSPDDAASLLQTQWAKQLDAQQRAWAWGAIGKQAAQKLSPDALNLFANASPADMSDEHLAWRTRAALRLGKWREALEALQAMGPQASSDATWVYWRARALQATAKTEPEQQQARQLLQSIASVRGFYELLAQEELGLPMVPPPAPEPLTTAEKEAARANPGLQRALAAIDLGLRPEGVREWNYTINLHQSGGLTDRELLAAADLACQHEVWDRCINTSERTKGVIDLTQRFPMPHKQAVLERSRAIGLDPAYVYGLIRQESRFVTDARSGVGASGLMQVMPATARWTAKKIGLTDFKPNQITERDTNIAIGTGYLKLVLDDFAGSMPMAAAAYNAGPGRPRSWRGQSGAPVMEAAIWAENVPFTETRDYVKKVLANTTIYAAMISGKTQSLKARLGQIGPRDGAATDNKDLP